MSETNVESVSTGLVWGIKSSFVSYVRSTPGSEIRVGGGGGMLGPDHFYFELEDASGFDGALAEGVVAFRGTVEFASHFGMLVVRIIDPWVHFDSDRVALTITHPSDAGGRLRIVDLIPQEPIRQAGMLRWDGMASSLTADAVELFNAVYPVGAPFDPVSIRVADHSERRPA